MIKIGWNAIKHPCRAIASGWMVNILKQGPSLVFCWFLARLALEEIPSKQKNEASVDTFLVCYHHKLSLLFSLSIHDQYSPTSSPFFLHGSEVNEWFIIGGRNKLAPPTLLHHHLCSDWLFVLWATSKPGCSFVSHQPERAKWDRSRSTINNW